MKPDNDIKLLREDTNIDLKEENVKEEVIEAKDIISKEEKKQKPARKAEEVAEEKQEECEEAYLLDYKPGADQTVRMTATSSLSGRPGDPSTLHASSLVSRSIRMASVGSQGARGITRGTPSKDNIGSLSLVGGDCQATVAAYHCTQFWDHGRGTTADRYALTNKKAECSSNLENALGLADEDQKAVAIPRGDCNKK